jgi:dihydropteroate synthase
MKIIKLSNDIDKDRLLKHIGSTKAGSEIMKDKMNLNFFYLKDIRTPAANILKQDALSIGAEVVVPKAAASCESRFVDALLIANDTQLKILHKKEKLQPFGLKKLADNLFDFIDTLDFKTKIMGVINANEDSFYEGSRFKGKEAIKKIEQMMLGGADIIDIGGVSSRPGSKSVDEEEEFLRIKPIVDEIYAAKLYEKIRFSLDSYSVKSLRYALERGFEIVNDITGLKNDEVAKIAAKFGASVVIMHMKGTPENMQKNPSYEDLIPEIEEFFSKRVQKAKSFGIKDKDIILDVGIGFGKSLKHNLLLIKHLGHFKKFGYELLVGASRKSMIDMIVKSPVEQRLPGTLSIHLKAVQNGASIIRCHDVKEHFQALRVQEAIYQALV